MQLTKSIVHTLSIVNKKNIYVGLTLLIISNYTQIVDCFVVRRRINKRPKFNKKTNNEKKDNDYDNIVLFLVIIFLLFCFIFHNNN